MSYSSSETHNMSGLGKQCNNGPHQDKIFDNPSVLSVPIIELGWGGGGGGVGEGGTDAPSRLFGTPSPCLLYSV